MCPLPTTGTFLPTGSDTQALLGELTHSAPKAFTGNQAVFTFAWTAPTFNDTVTLYGAGNSSDGQQSLSGDDIGTTNLAIQVGVLLPVSPDATTGDAGPQTALSVASASRPILPMRVIAASLSPRRWADSDCAKWRGLCPFLDITTRVDAGDGTVETDAGLAFHPNYTTSTAISTSITM